LSLLMELKRSQGMSMVLITHDMGAVAGVADRVAVMRDGAVVEAGTAHAVFKAPQHEYTRALLAAVPRIDGAVMVARGAVNTLVPSSAVSAPALVLDNVRVQFNVRAGWFAASQVLRAVDGVSLELAAGEALGV